MFVPEQLNIQPLSCSHLSGGEFPWRLQCSGLIVPDMDSADEYTEAPNSDANVLTISIPIGSSLKVGGVFSYGTLRREYQKEQTSQLTVGRQLRIMIEADHTYFRHQKLH